MFDDTQPLLLEWISGDKGGRYRLHEGFNYWDSEGDDGAGWLIEVPPGFETDLASIPRPLWSYLPKSGSYSKAAVIHDYLYWAGRVGQVPITRAYADAVLRRGCADLGVPWARRWLIWSAVRVGGGKIWQTYRQERP